MSAFIKLVLALLSCALIALVTYPLTQYGFWPYFLICSAFGAAAFILIFRTKF